MAELATRAVQSLLGVIRDETRLLGRVEADVNFIMEEMESMNSFLLHLSRREGHGEPVRTWMNQVRKLADDCSDSIDHYLLCGNSAVYRRDMSPLGYTFFWVPLYLKKLAAQHKAAVQLSELKDRARDVADRRLRYEVHIPTLPGDVTPAPATDTGPAAAATSSSSSQLVLGEEEEDDGPEEMERRLVWRAQTNAAEPPCIEDECRNELVDWLLHTRSIHYGNINVLRAITIVAPKRSDGVEVAFGAVAHAFPFPLSDKFECKFPVNVFLEEDTMTLPALSAGPLDILQAIMMQLYPHDEDHHDSAKVQQPHEVGDINTAGWFHYMNSDSQREASLTYEQEMINIIEQVDQRLKNKLKAEDRKKMPHIDVKIERIKENIQDHLLHMRRSGDDIPVDAHFAIDMLLHGIHSHPGFISRFSIEHLEETYRISALKIDETAKMIKEHIESTPWPSVGLDYKEYGQILWYWLCEVECDPRGEQARQREAKNKSHEDPITKHVKSESSDEQIADHIKETAEKVMVNKLLLLLKPSKAAEENATCILGKPQTPEDSIKHIMTKINGALEHIKKKLQSKMVDMIKEKVRDRKLLIFLIGMNYVYKWDEIMEALSSIGCTRDSVVVVTTKYSHGSNQFCNPQREPILCYLARSYYKRVLKMMMKQQPINYNTRILYDILESCEPHQFSMKIFAHAMHANPRRKEGELHRLLETLAPGSGHTTNDKIMIRFSYNDLPKEYKTCLLYLAIFQPKEAINRSRLIGRWVVEGLIAKQDWSSSVRQAERCFDALVDRYLICPVDNISVTGKVKSCTVDATVHEFITQVARKEHFVGTRLSRHMARQLSIFSDIRLHNSDILERSLGKLSGTPKLPLVKVLDLEGCEGLDNKKCLKHICNNMLLLKYLGLRNTGISRLPKDINNLHQLEVLDIRQKKNTVTASTRLKRLPGNANPTPTNTENIVTVSTTRDVLLLKLKRLLAGSSTQPNTEHARIPRGIAKMTNLDVLSSVKASLYRDFKNISRLWQLRKLGVVIDDDKARHLTYLLNAIGDLSESLRSLSITLTHGKGGTRDNGNIAKNIGDNNYSNNPPKLLESLSIDGYTCKGQLIPWLLKDNKLPTLAKVTLCNTFLNKGNMEHLAELDNLCCLRLMCGAYTDSRLSFLCAKFRRLKYLLVECGKPDEISFDVGAAPELSKMVLSFTNMEESLSPSLWDKQSYKVEGARVQPR